MVKELTKALGKAYKRGDAKMIRRILVLLDYSRGDSVESIASKHGIVRSSLYSWLKKLLVGGLSSLKPNWKGGRGSKLSKNQRKRLCDLIKASPQAAGYATDCWSGHLVQDLIWQEFGVLYNAHYVCALLKSLGFSYQKAQLVSDHLDEAKRLVWMKQTFPELKRKAQAAGGLFLFGDEASFAQLPSYSPDYNPIEFLWRSLKRRTTHNQYFPEFDTLSHSVDDALLHFQTQTDYVKSLFTIYLDEMATASVA